MLLLLLSVAALAAGPVFGLAVRRSALVAQFVDGFVVLGVLALTLGHILPHTVAEIGVWTWPAWLVGLWLPMLLHGGAASCGHHTSGGMLAVAVFALGLHALLDGVALVHVGSPDVALALAVVLHRLLEGISVWWLTRRASALQRLAALGGVATATVVGFVLGERAVGVGLGPLVALVQAAVAGSLLHVLARHPQLDTAAADQLKWPLRLASGAGGLLAAGLFVLESEALHGGGAHAGHAHPAAAALAPLGDVFAPSDVGLCILLGLGVVALGHALAASALSQRLAARVSGMRGAWWGAMAGAGSALCSCGVVPLWRQRLAHRRPLRECVAFLLAAPALGPLSLVLSFALMGPRWTLMRLACVVGIAAGVALIVSPQEGGPSTGAQPSVDETPHASACNESIASALGDGVAYATGDVLAFAAPWLLAGLAGAHLLTELLAPAWLEAVATSNVALVVLIVVLAPLYVAAEATTLCAVVLTGLGTSPAVALAICLSGGMLSWVSAAELRMQLGLRRAAAGVALVLGAIVASTHWLGSYLQRADAYGLGAVLSEQPSTRLMGTLGLALIAGATLRQGIRGSLDQIAAPNRHTRYGVHHGHS